MDKKSATDVFTPNTQARVNFVERASINSRLVDAIKTPGKQIIVFGHSGSGKSTLLVKKLFSLYENHITTRCTVGLTFEQMLLNAFSDLKVYYSNELESSRKASISPTLKAQFFGIEGALGGLKEESHKEVKRLLLPPQLTPQNLARFIGAAKACWLVEDFHKLEPAEKTKFAQVMKLFVDTANEYPATKVVAIGAVQTAREIVEFDQEMKTRVAEISVPLLDKLELEKILTEGGRLLNLEFPAAVISNIVAYSNGLGAVCHQLALNICFELGVVETLDQKKTVTQEDFLTALKRYVEETSDQLKGKFGMAYKQNQGRFENAKLILCALSTFELEGATRGQLFECIRKKFEPGYLQGNLSNYLKLLANEEKGSLIRYDAKTGYYCFQDPLYLVFAQASLKTFAEAKSAKAKAKKPVTRETINLESIEAISLDALFGEVARKYLTTKLTIRPVTVHTTPAPEEPTGPAAQDDKR